MAFGSIRWVFNRLLAYRDKRKLSVSLCTFSVRFSEATWNRGSVRALETRTQ
jgi:hypothetical protein